jgi:hypothetical protein
LVRKAERFGAKESLEPELKGMLARSETLARGER